jgi:hypothetical protein
MLMNIREAVQRYLIGAAILIACAIAPIRGISDTPPSGTTETVADDPCGTTPCRDAKSIVLFAGTRSELHFNVPREPYTTSDGHIVIVPGERLVFRFTAQGDTPGTPRFVRAETLTPASPLDLSDPTFDKLDKTDPNTFAFAAQLGDYKVTGTAKDHLKNEPPGTLILTYREIPGATGMMLTIEHNLSHAMKLAAFMMVPTAEGFKLQYTTTCSINVGIEGLETWRQPLGGLILEKFQYLPDDQKNGVCD